MIFKQQISLLFDVIMIQMQQKQKMEREIDRLYQGDNLPNQVKSNMKDFLTIFSQRFEQTIEAQRYLTINLLNDHQSKHLIAQYLNTPATKQKMIDQLANQKLLTKVRKIVIKFQSGLQIQKEQYSTRESKYDNFLKLVNNKAKINNASLTLYNQYAQLSKRIKFHFKPTSSTPKSKKRLQLKDEERDNSWQLKMGNYQKKTSFVCQFCIKNTETKAALANHQKHCPKRVKVESTNTQKTKMIKRQTRQSKRHESAEGSQVD